jgi:tRNA (guanine-N7-)-methyltransferase
LARKLKTDIPGPDWRRGFLELKRTGLASAFSPELAPPLELVVEIGFGRGEFLMHLARSRPELALLGIEVSHKRVLKMARRLAKTEIRNVRLIESGAELVLREILPEASVCEFWINFPDPWPKKRHVRRRLIRPPFAADLASRMEPGGRVNLATDDPGYAQQIHEVLSKQVGLENRFAPSPWLPEVPGRPPTAYELEWRAEGRPLHFFAYGRAPD